MKCIGREESGNILTSPVIAPSTDLNELLPRKRFVTDRVQCAVLMEIFGFSSANGRYFLEIVSSEEKDVT